MRNYFGDFAKVMVVDAFVLDAELKFKSRLGSEFLQVEIPDSHFVRVRQRLPHSRRRRIEGAFEHNRLRQFILCSHVFLPLLFRFNPHRLV